MAKLIFQNNSVYDVPLTDQDEKEVAFLRPEEWSDVKEKGKYQIRGPLASSVSVTLPNIKSDARIGFSFPPLGGRSYIAITNNTGIVITATLNLGGPVVIPDQETWWFKKLAETYPETIEIEDELFKIEGTFGTFNLHFVLSKPE